jgi:hypothetical protein
MSLTQALKWTTLVLGLVGMKTVGQFMQLQSNENIFEG